MQIDVIVFKHTVIHVNIDRYRFFCHVAST